KTVLELPDNTNGVTERQKTNLIRIIGEYGGQVAARRVYQRMNLTSAETDQVASATGVVEKIKVPTGSRPRVDYRLLGISSESPEGGDEPNDTVADPQVPVSRPKTRTNNGD